MDLSLLVVVVVTLGASCLVKCRLSPTLEPLLLAVRVCEWVRWSAPGREGRWGIIVAVVVVGGDNERERDFPPLIFAKLRPGILVFFVTLDLDTHDHCKYGEGTVPTGAGTHTLPNHDALS